MRQPELQTTAAKRWIVESGVLNYGGWVKLLLENLPPSLRHQRDTLAQCLTLMDAALPLQAVLLFGSHSRGEARPDSDVDLCLIAEGADRQLDAARRYREALWTVWPCPAFTLLPITPSRLAEKRAGKDPFFATVFREGIAIAS